MKPKYVGLLVLAFLALLGVALSARAQSKLLEGLWIRTIPGDTQEEYKLTPEANSGFTLVKVRFRSGPIKWKKVAPHNQYGFQYPTVYGILSGNQITGTADWWGCRKLSRIPITGEVLEVLGEARQIVIRFREPEDCDTGYGIVHKDTVFEYVFERE